MNASNDSWAWVLILLISSNIILVYDTLKTVPNSKLLRNARLQLCTAKVEASFFCVVFVKVRLCNEIEWNTLRYILFFWGSVFWGKRLNKCFD